MTLIPERTDMNHNDMRLCALELAIGRAEIIDESFVPVARAFYEFIAGIDEPAPRDVINAALDKAGVK
jgi:hypothetical protein